MHSLGNSIRTRWYCLRVSPRAARKAWHGRYWREEDGFRVIPCRRCPKFDPVKEICRVPFGSPLRKCVVAAIEANLNDLKGKKALELGFGRFSLARRLIRRSGGSWTGVEPSRKNPPSGVGHGGYGHAADIPFPEETFDLVFGIQSFEHWAQRRRRIEGDQTYEDCLAEILRVLKPGGTLYVDAPIHFHGHEMFIMGDLKRITGLFGADSWTDLTVEKWRLEHEPLAPHLAARSEIEEWPYEVVSYDPEDLAKLREGRSVWLLTVKARKRPVPRRKR